MNELPVEEPLFAARLTPYRSLGKTGFVVLMAFVAVTCFISGMLFLVIGAWPVFAFFGLDVLLIWLAFKMNYRSGRAWEEIAVWKHQLEFRQFSPSGKATIHEFNPYWTRFRIDRHDEIGITRMCLVDREREIDVGAFLNPLDRQSFADAFGAALAEAKAG
jgi:uncharacterized membrane protein